jgi:serine dehydrogenase proteinase
LFGGEVKRRLEALERARGSRVLLLATSHLELDLLPALYDALREIGPTRRLDVLFHCCGGVANAARRVALLLHGFTDHLAFIVPDRCESSGMIAALSAREIVAGPAAIFSPVDPHLEAAPGSGETRSAISAQDVRLFARMSERWFGLAEDEARAKALAVLCESIFPTTLTSFYRSTLEVEAIGAELLALGLPAASPEARSQIVDALVYGHHSHGFALTRDDLRALGLPVREDEAAEAMAWDIARILRPALGAGARRSPGDDWFDALVATSAGSMRRRRSPDGLAPRWEAGALE